MLETQSTKATAVGESNSAGVLRQSPNRQKPTRVRGWSPRRCCDFTAFSKNSHFLAYFGL